MTCEYTRCFASRLVKCPQRCRTVRAVKNKAMRSESAFLEKNPRTFSNRIEGTAEGYKKQAKLDGIPE